MGVVGSVDLVLDFYYSFYRILMSNTTVVDNKFVFVLENIRCCAVCVDEVGVWF